MEIQTHNELSKSDIATNAKRKTQMERRSRSCSMPPDRWSLLMMLRATTTRLTTTSTETTLIISISSIFFFCILLTTSLDALHSIWQMRQHLTRARSGTFGLSDLGSDSVAASIFDSVPGLLAAKLSWRWRNAAPLDMVSLFWWSAANWGLCCRSISCAYHNSNNNNNT